MLTRLLTRTWLGVAVGCLALTGALFVVARAAARVTAGPIDPPHREAQSDGEQPAISFIDSPSATCYLPARGTSQCYIQWNYLNVSASASQYIISMTVEIDGRLRAYHTGFFQTAMYIPGDMFGDGFQVTCGAPGNVGFGHTYAYTLRARETGGLSAANYGSVTCPGDLVTVFMPVVLKQ